MKITDAHYFEASENYEGYCTVCDDFTREMTEPDAKNYKCPVCGGMTVIGAENAMLSGHIEIDI